MGSRARLLHDDWRKEGDRRVSRLSFRKTRARLCNRIGNPWTSDGPNGAGHFVKMVHNGIEYGVMAVYAEGLSILRAANVGIGRSTADAETTPLRVPSSINTISICRTSPSCGAEAA